MYGTRSSRSWLVRIAGTGAALLMLVGCTDRPAALSPLAPGEVERLIVPVPQLYTAVSAGPQAGCSVSEDGMIRCWGVSSFGEAPSLWTAATGKFVAVEQAGNLFSCGLRDDGAVECVGRDIPNYPVLGTHTATSPHHYQAISTGVKHVCALREDGVAECWGEDKYGQAPATKAAQSGLFVQISAGGVHTCALRNDGVVECWGDQGSDTQAAPTTWSTSAPGGFINVGTGNRHSCAVRTDGQLECVGDNGGGQAPASLVAQLGKFVEFHGGNHESCARRDDGVVECWGMNDDRYDNAPPAVTPSVGTFVSISYEGLTGCGLRSDGAAQCWGYVTGTRTSAPTTTHVNPAADLTAPSTVIANNPIAVTLTNPRIPGYPAAVATYRYAFDCGTGYGVPGTSNAGSCATTSAGQRTVKGKVIDQDNDFAEYSANVTVITAQQATSQLTTSVSGATLAPDLRKALLAKLNAALDAMKKGKTATACGALADFINQVTAQRGKAIPIATADAWLLTANQLRTSLGC